MLEQKQLINKILQTKDYKLVTDNNLSDKYFSNYKAEFNYIRDYYEKYSRVPDIATFNNIFPEYKSANEPVEAPNEYLLEQVYDNYYKEFAAEQFNQLRELLESDKPEAGSQALELLREIGDNAAKAKVTLKDTYIDLAEDFSRFDHYKERTLNQTEQYIPTGFPELDDLIGGIDRLNENMVIAAKTGVGKSWLLMKIATAAYSMGLRVGLYSGEMHEDKVGYRVDTILGGLSNKALNRGDIREESDYLKYINRMKNNKLVEDGKEGHFFVQTPAMLNKDDGATVADLRKFVEDAKLDILFIDQYSLLNDTSRNAKQQYEQVGNISKAIKNLQVLKQIPIISVSQLHRDGKKDPKEEEEDSQNSEQIALSYRISQDATIIIMLSKKPIDPDSGDVVAKREAGKKYTKYLFTLNVVKSRDGGEGKVTYAIDLDTFDCQYFDKKDKSTRSDDKSDSDEYMEGNYDPETGEIIEDDDDLDEDEESYMKPVRN